MPDRWGILPPCKAKNHRNPYHYHQGIRDKRSKCNNGGKWKIALYGPPDRFRRTTEGCLPLWKTDLGVVGSSTHLIEKKGLFASPVSLFWKNGVGFLTFKLFELYFLDFFVFTQKHRIFMRCFCCASFLSTHFGTPDWIRTSGLVSRSHTRYPTAPRART